MHRRRRLLAAAAAALLAAAGPAAVAAADGVVPAADAARIKAVIRAQLAAFAADDAVRAFGHASDEIRAQFGTAERFIEMVKAEYPVVARPLTVDFLQPVLRDGAPVQTVRMSDGRGAVWVATYLMQRQNDGNYRIAGCVLRPTNSQVS